MSYLDIRVLLDAGKQALGDNNYWAALYVALLLPSAGARFSYQDDETYWTQSGGRRKWLDKKAYVDWCNGTLFGSNMGLRSLLGSGGANLLYKLRCSFVHEGVSDGVFCEDGLNYYLVLGSDRNSCFRYENKVFIPLEELCSAIFRAFYNWSAYNSDMYVDTLFFDMSKPADKEYFHILEKRAREKQFDQLVENHETRQRLKNGKLKEEQSNGNQ